MGKKSNTSTSIEDLVDTEPEEVEQPGPDVDDNISDDAQEYKLGELAETPHRCTKCNRLIFKGEVGVGGIVKHKCGKCGTMNEFRTHMIPENFQDKMYQNRRRRITGR